MTPGELTHALQSLFNQSEADKNWFANVRGVLEHHAERIDNTSRKVDTLEAGQFTLEEEQATLTSQTRALFAQTETFDLQSKAAVAQNDVQLKAVIEATVAAADAKLAELHMSMENLKTVVGTSLDEVNVYVREQGARFGGEMRNLTERVTATGACAAAATPTVC